MKCRFCGRSGIISKALSVCLACIRSSPQEALKLAQEAHAQSRVRFGLPSQPPRDSQGVRCSLCGNECQIPSGGKGFCGLRINKEGKLVHLAGTPGKAVVEWYFDALPTNCVAEWCCAGGTGAGYPKYSYAKNSPEYGYKNLAVFYGACSFDCLFCQNWHCRERTAQLAPLMSAEELARCADEKTSCICYFGGDPSPQIAHAIRTSEIAREKAGERILRICFETNGNESMLLLKKAAQLSLESGGCIKVDLKAFDENLNLALCGVSNKAVRENFKWLASYCKQRKEPPFLIASTLLVPGYVDADEVEKIAQFIAGLDDSIPYSLLAFYPQFEMRDLPATSRRQAEECLAVARKHLRSVRLGNVHLLS